MPTKLVALSAVLGLLVLACKKESTTEPTNQTTGPFSVGIAVVNSAGQPVPGLRISAWNKLAFGSIAPDGVGRLPVSSVPFRVGLTSRVNLSLYEMNGSFHSTVWSDTLVDGNYIGEISLPVRVPTRVFKCRFIARALGSDAILHRDSIFVVLHQPDPSVSILGWTNQSGTFQTADQLLFPNVLTLPPMVRTNSGGPQPVGTFNIPDSVTIVLTDTTTHQAQTFARAVRKGPNSIQLTWNPGPSSSRPAFRLFPQHSVSLVKPRKSSNGAAQWELDQNYPNPFN